jgi:hypothetical protein
MFCEECSHDSRSDGLDHEPWCSRGDPGQRPSAALIWERIEELEQALNQRLDRLAVALGLPADWDADGR